VNENQERACFALWTRAAEAKSKAKLLYLITRKWGEETADISPEEAGFIRQVAEELWREAQAIYERSQALEDVSRLRAQAKNWHETNNKA
jgi:hypothetical protein